MGRVAQWLIVVLLAAQVGLSAIGVANSLDQRRRERWRDWKSRVDETRGRISALRRGSLDMSGPIADAQKMLDDDLAHEPPR